MNPHDLFQQHQAHSNPRIRRTLLSLHGLSVGDAFGEKFFASPATVLESIERRVVPASPWPTTDDTEMALSIVETLFEEGCIVQDKLAQKFAHRYALNPNRGYGSGAHSILEKIGAGVPWAEAAGAVFDGTGSMGNGGAMRAGVIGAWFADDIDRTIEQARLSAQVTHTHPEGQAGAIAIAVAAALAWNIGQEKHPPTLAQRRKFMEDVVAHTPESQVRDRLRKVLNLPLNFRIETVVNVVGNGSQIIAQDTVPLTIWCAARHLDHYQEAAWTTVSALGDRDTTCAIVGSIVALCAPSNTLPAQWLESREPLNLDIPA